MPIQFHLRSFGPIRASLACILSAIHLWAALAGAEPLRIAYTSIAVVYGPLWLTKEAGLFKKYTIDPEFLYAATRSIAAGTTPQRFAESRFIRELVASGFVDNLYKGR